MMVGQKVKVEDGSFVKWIDWLFVGLVGGLLRRWGCYHKLGVRGRPPPVKNGEAVRSITLLLLCYCFIVLLLQEAEARRLIGRCRILCTMSYI